MIFLFIFAAGRKWGWILGNLANGNNKDEDSSFTFYHFISIMWLVDEGMRHFTSFF